MLEICGRGTTKVGFQILKHNCNRSGGFLLDEAKSVFLRLKKLKDNSIHYVRVDVKTHSSVDRGLTTFIIFCPKGRKVVPYQIENYTRGTAIYWQEGVSL